MQVKSKCIKPSGEILITLKQHIDSDIKQVFTQESDYIIWTAMYISWIKRQTTTNK